MFCIEWLRFCVIQSDCGYVVIKVAPLYEVESGSVFIYVAYTKKLQLIKCGLKWLSYVMLRLDAIMCDLEWLQLCLAQIGSG